MGRADELKLEIEALKLQLEVEKLTTARFLQNAVQAPSETSGLGRYAKDLKAVLVPMPADDTMVPAWFKMADMLLKMLGVPEEMQGTLILPFLTEKVRTSLSGTCSYEELKEKVLKELKLTPTEYRRCFPEIKKEVREHSCDRTKLTGSFGKAITADVKHVPLSLPCPSGNTQPVSLPCAVTPELTTSAEVLLTPGGYDSHYLAMSRSEHNTEGSVCGLVERSAEQEVILANGVDTATPFCDEDIARDAVGEEPNKGGEDNMWLGASLEPTHESDKEERFATVPNGPVADRVTSKLKAVLDKNPGFYVLKQVSNVLSGADSKIPVEIRASKVPDYKYAPLTSVDVERSFSAYKQILTERRHNFKPENLEMVLVCHCFHSLYHSVQSP
ncbi:hypothetical protein HPB50_003418 [Hyalomma asiaticum]|uniref:Uncharacterized protein n=1 Tax=Hyalomma asiaticum TaxID=266040 RepID=A0ACB7SIY1_HYAAI|nr:hypothetical protein HPB50_003418 [Hyalomma asiaticum]